MDGRSTKYRSLDSRVADGPPPARPRDRQNSAPLIERRRDSHSQRHWASTKSSDGSRRGSKASHRDDDRRGSETTRGVSTARSSESRSGHPTESRPNLKTRDAAPDVSTLTFSVIGTRRVGKTTFIRTAIDLESPSSTPFSSNKVTLNGSVYRIQFVELALDDVDFSGHRVTWPTYLNGSPVPPIDGCFCLYDVTSQISVADVPSTLTALTSSDVPCVLVAAKCDAPDKAREINSRFHDHVRRNLPTVSIAQISTSLADSQKQCLLTLLNRVLAFPRKTVGSKSTTSLNSRGQPRAMPVLSSREVSPEKSRSRSRSLSSLRISKSRELLLNLSARPAVIQSEDEETEEDSSDDNKDHGNNDEDDEDDEPPMMMNNRNTKLRLDTNTASRPPGRPAEPQTPVSSGDPSTNSRLITPEPASTIIPETPDSYYMKSMLRPGTADTADSRAFQTFLNMDEESHDDSPPTEIGSLSTATSKPKVEDGSRQETGVPFAELVNRLLSLPSSKQDSKFVPSFLCLYRAFATPRQLLVAIVDQFMKLEKSNLVHFSKVAEMLRYLQVLAQWTASYAGDFGNNPTRDMAITFVQSIEKSKVFAPAAREISNNLEIHVKDDDLDWAYDDASVSATSKTGSAATTAATTKKGSLSSSTSMPLSTTRDGGSKTPRSAQKDLDSSEDDNDGGESSSAYGSGAPSSSSSILKTGNNSSQSFTNFMQLENAKSRAETLKALPHIRLGKFQWHQFMDIPVEELAREITRIDWTMYSAIRPRDFVRHVCLTTEQKRRSRQVDNISAMVRHFNHLALFVSGMVLLRDKPKHRARALEKFMDLAWQVRKLNNYNSLGAIVAGITGHEIARLTATQELVPPDVQKQFLRLTILMGISRSYAPYRMAWENSFTERIPFLPLLRQDLTMAATANQTFIGENVNWKKFEIMGEVMVGVQKSLEQPYGFGPRSLRSDEIVKLILETKVLEESEDSADPRSELYERSVQVEPQAGVDTRKKFDWLRRWNEGPWTI